MKTNWIGSVVVFGVAIGIVGVKLGCNPSPSAAHASSEEAVAAKGVAPRVVLVADLGEADSDCGCGRIIKAVRDTAARGVPTIEIDPRKDADGAKKYNAVMTPTVIVMDEAGKEAHRYEGEASETIKKMKEELEKLPGKS